jgi:hypothetical protein
MKKNRRHIVWNKYEAPLSKLHYNSPSFTIEEESSTSFFTRAIQISHGGNINL